MTFITRFLSFFVCACMFAIPTSAFAVAKLFDGRIVIDGVTLLQDSGNPGNYYYVPPYPVLAQNPDGGYAFSYIRYLNGAEGKSGGVLTAVAQISLPDEVYKSIESQLMNEHGSRLVGSVQFTNPAPDVTEGTSVPATFKVEMATIGQPGATTLSSGIAPIGEGTRTTIAASLSPDDANLFWGAIQVGSYTDVAFSISAAYLARIEAYNAVVEAESDTVYTHFSELDNQQEGFTRDQLRTVVDELIQDQVISVKESDTGQAFDITSIAGQALLKNITDELTKLMFDTKTGWARPVDMEKFDEKQIKGRVAGGKISGSFFGLPGFGSGSMGYEENTNYVPDDQYVLKNIQEIRQVSFYFDYSRAQVVRVPYQSSGNLGAIFVRLKGDPHYFQTVDLEDSLRGNREISFVVQSDYKDAFKDFLDSVTIDVRSGLSGSSQVSHRLTADEVQSGAAFPVVEIKKPLSGASDGWHSYSYRVAWYLRGKSEPIRVPAGGGWSNGDSDKPIISPPFQQASVQLFVDQAAFQGGDVELIAVNLMSKFQGEAKILKTVRIQRGQAPDGAQEVKFYHDPGAPIVSRIDYVSSAGTVKGETEMVEEGFIYVRGRSGG